MCGWRHVPRLCWRPNSIFRLDQLGLRHLQRSMQPKDTSVAALVRVCLLVRYSKEWCGCNGNIQSSCLLTFNWTKIQLKMSKEPCIFLLAVTLGPHCSTAKWELTRAVCSKSDDSAALKRQRLPCVRVDYILRTSSDKFGQLKGSQSVVARTCNLTNAT